MRTAALALCLAVAGAPAALAQLEGTAEFKVTTITGKGEAVPGTGKISSNKNGYRMEWQTDISKIVKGRAVRAENGPQQIKMTMVGKASSPDRLYLIDDANRTYSVWDLKKARSESSADTATTYTVTRLGPDKVAGLICQKAELVSSPKGTVIDVCVAGELGVSLDWLAAIGRRQKESTSWITALRNNSLSGFPVRYSMREKDASQPFVTLEMTKIERGPVSDALFEVPPGYKETEFAIGGLSPEQQKAVSDARARMKAALDRMTPEQRKAYEDAMRKSVRPTPNSP